jgi:hypothetical protein
MSSFTNRLIRSALLDVNIYEEVEADSSALWQAMLVVVLSSIAGGIGSIYYFGVGGVITGSISSLISWVVWAAIIYFIGAKFIPEPQTEANLGQLLRTIGFASSPGLIRVVGIIPGLESIVALIAWVWMIFTTVIAARQALDYKSTVRAIIVCLIAGIAYGLVSFLFVGFFGQP